jgi:hypothetical protein
MAKLDSVPLYPTTLFGGLSNLCLNKNPTGKYQVARVLKPGGPQEGEFQVLFEGNSEHAANQFAIELTNREQPGLLK